MLLGDEVGVAKLDSKWILEVKKYFKKFLDETGFPHDEEKGSRGPESKFPEWLIMFIAVLAVKNKIKSYVGIHKMTSTYWESIGKDFNPTPISERQLRDRLKKIGFKLGKTPGFILQIFPESFLSGNGKLR